MQTIKFSFDDSESGEFREAAFNFLMDARERIEKVMQSEFGVNPDDDEAMEAFLAPVFEAINALKKSLDCLEGPSLSDGRRVGDTARGILAFAYLATDLGANLLHDGSLYKCLELAGVAFESLGRAEQSILDRKSVV